FDRVFFQEVRLSNAPLITEPVYGQAFFPLSDPVRVCEGDAVDIRIRADLVGEDYVWRWDTRIFGQTPRAVVKADFQQSSFFSVPLSPSRLRRRVASHSPSLNLDGRLRRYALSLMDGQHSVEYIAQRLRECFPTRFRNAQDALTLAADLSEE